MVPSEALSIATNKGTEMKDQTNVGFIGTLTRTFSLLLLAIWCWTPGALFWPHDEGQVTDSGPWYLSAGRKKRMSHVLAFSLLCQISVRKSKRGGLILTPGFKGKSPLCRGRHGSRNETAGHPEASVIRSSAPACRIRPLTFRVGIPTLFNLI